MKPLTEAELKDALNRLQFAGRLIEEARTTMKLTPKEFCKKYNHKLTPELLAYIERGFIVE